MDAVETELEAMAMAALEEAPGSGRLSLLGRTLI